MKSGRVSVGAGLFVGAPVLSEQNSENARDRHESAQPPDGCRAG